MSRRGDALPVALFVLLAAFVAFQVAAARGVGADAVADGRANPSPAGTPEAAPTGDRRPPSAADLTRLREGAAGTYVHALLERDSTLVRWPVADGRPIRVWVQPSSPVRGWRAGQVAMARDAFRAWEGELPLRIEWSADSAGADVRVRWVARLPGTEQIGNSSRSYDEDGRIVAAEIVLALAGREDRALPEQTAWIAALHEVGHVLGLEHSPDPRDVMVARYDGRATGLSPADVATARLLYSLPSGRY